MQTVQQTIEILQVLLVFDGAVNMQRQVPAGEGEVPLLQFIDRVVFLVVNRDRHPWAICGYRRDSTVAVLGSTRSSMCQGLPMEAFGRIFFSSCCSRCSLGNLDIVFSSSLYLAATCTRVLRQSTEALGRNTFVFYLKVDPDPEVDSPGAVRTGKIRTLFPRAALMAEVMAVWRLMVLFFYVFAPFSALIF